MNIYFNIINVFLFISLLYININTSHGNENILTPQNSNKLTKDFTYYFETYRYNFHFNFDNVNNNNNIISNNINILNDNLNINILFYMNTSSYIFNINNNISLNYDYDNDWNEIQTLILSSPSNTNELNIEYFNDNNEISTDVPDEYMAYEDNNINDNSSPHSLYSPTYKNGRFIGIKHPRKYYDAQRVCQYKYNGQLAIINNEIDTLEINKLCKQLSYNNKINNKTNGCWIQFKQNDNKCNEIINNGILNNNKCNIRNPFICEIETIKTAQTDDYIAVAMPLDWDYANQYCHQRFETELASVLSLEHNIYVNSICKSVGSKDSCWIGLKRPFNKWQDGNTMQYNNWNTNEPNNDQTDESCTEILYTTGQWNDSPCRNNKYFICNYIGIDNYGISNNNIDINNEQLLESDTRRQLISYDRSGRECDESFKGYKGVGYRGCQTKTVKGFRCQKWTSQSPHRHGNTPSRRRGKGLSNHNYCRNPDGEKTIWCYTTSKRKRWDYCKPISNGWCDERRRGRKNNGYRGCQTKTVKGLTCQKWTRQSPHRHGNTPARKRNKGLGDHNFCRNPDGERDIWCYTTSRRKRWDYCKPKRHRNRRKKSRKPRRRRRKRKRRKRRKRKKRRKRRKRRKPRRRKRKRKRRKPRRRRRKRKSKRWKCTRIKFNEYDRKICLRKRGRRMQRRRWQHKLRRFMRRGGNGRFNGLGRSFKRGYRLGKRSVMNGMGGSNGIRGAGIRSVRGISRTYGGLGSRGRLPTVGMPKLRLSKISKFRGRRLPRPPKIRLINLRGSGTRGGKRLRRGQLGSGYNIGMRGKNHHRKYPFKSSAIQAMMAQGGRMRDLKKAAKLFDIGYRQEMRDEGKNRRNRGGNRGGNRGSNRGRNRGSNRGGNDGSEGFGGFHGFDGFGSGRLKDGTRRMLIDVEEDIDVYDYDDMENERKCMMYNVYEICVGFDFIEIKKFIKKIYNKELNGNGNSLSVMDDEFMEYIEYENDKYELMMNDINGINKVIMDVNDNYKHLYYLELYEFIYDEMNDETEQCFMNLEMFDVCLGLNDKKDMIIMIDGGFDNNEYRFNFSEDSDWNEINKIIGNDDEVEKCVRLFEVKMCMVYQHNSKFKMILYRMA